MITAHSWRNKRELALLLYNQSQIGLFFSRKQQRLLLNKTKDAEKNAFYPSRLGKWTRTYEADLFAYEGQPAKCYENKADFHISAKGSFCKISSTGSEVMLLKLNLKIHLQEISREKAFFFFLVLALASVIFLTSWRQDNILLLKVFFFIASHSQSKNLKYLRTQRQVAEFFHIYKDEVIFWCDSPNFEVLFVIVWCLFKNKSYNIKSH